METDDIMNLFSGLSENIPVGVKADLSEEDTTSLKENAREIIMNIERFICMKTENLKDIPDEGLSQIAHALTQLHSLASNYQ